MTCIGMTTLSLGGSSIRMINTLWRASIATILLLSLLVVLGYQRVQLVQASVDVKVNSEFLNVGQQRLHYVQTGNRNAQVRIVFIHGTPGEWKNYSRYLADEKLIDQADLVAVDRIGFGQSSPVVDTSLVSQAKSLLPLLETDQKVVLVGHSLGGSLAARMAMDYPDKVDGILLVAASLDPSLEAPRWYNHIIDWPVIRWFAPNKMLKANQEIYSLAAELEKMDKDWPKLQAEVHIIHGKEDNLAYFGNAEYAVQKLAGKAVTLHAVENEGHFILWENDKLIKQNLLALIKTL